MCTFSLPTVKVCYKGGTTGLREYRTSRDAVNTTLASETIRDPLSATGKGSAVHESAVVVSSPLPGLSQSPSIPQRGLGERCNLPLGQGGKTQPTLFCEL
jgi:hypothetical protein